MSKPTSFAKEDVMEAYLGGLLSGHEELDEHKEKAAKLLSNVELLEIATAEHAADTVEPAIEDVTSEVVEAPTPVIKEPVISEPEPESEPQAVIDVAKQVTHKPIVDSLEETFQALFFEVAGLTLAVPLVTLGGIHQIDKVGPLFGKPSWFMGVMLHREQKLNVVDTAKWVMPEKITQTLEDGLNYSYLIMLAESPWGLASENLVNTVTLTKSDVKWRDKDSKRPWLAGMVKERMCALVDVYQLVSMLNKGLSSDSQD